MAEMNRQVTLAARPKGLPKVTDFQIIETPMPELGGGEVLIKTLFLSVDPYMRGRMNEGGTYARGVNIGEVMTGGTVGEVISSTDPTLQPGDIVQSQLGWQAYGKTFGSEVRKIDPDLAPISTSLGVLGMPGLTAYFGLLEVAKPVKGDLVLVSGAAGAVGSLVGQIARLKGCRAIGIAGGSEKIAYIVDDLGFDGAFNYKRAADYDEELTRLCPEGIDVYFDNVGGPISDAVFPHMNVFGRISVCGQISQYNQSIPEPGPRTTWHFIAQRLTMRGFLVFDFAEHYVKALKELAGWVRSGNLKYREDIWEGLENAPGAFIDMLQGGNMGKRLIKVA
ncbi:MAG: NADP-dependent oxidoreductase [bacterium]|nr:NADP-dependent oxidoreductase [bacterium]